MLTLAEASKLIQNPLQRGIVEIFPQTSPVLQYMPFMDVAGNAYSYNLEQTLPGIAFRDYNENYTESTGVVNPKTEKLFIMGGVSKVDRALVKTQGNLNNIRAIHDAMKAKAAALEFSSAFFKGDNAANAKQFDGLQKRLTGGQLLSAGKTAGGDTLTLAMLDELIDAVHGGPTCLFMNKTMRRKVNALVRSAGQATETVSDVFGKQIPAYAGIPIAVIEEGPDGNAILDFDEPCETGSTDTGTSIYAVRFGVSEYVSGLQAGPLEVIDNGLVGIFYETLIEWICGLAVFHPKAAARLYGLKAA